ncbi:glyoxalase [Microlunatus sp. Gsoil 973]|jgi:predicted lactoylglutathione lyase|uniref:glyoxalase n=1 Tax=Microlunatus sp. Gsoil 973 TaxID=2672569 RepID=UPI0012B44B9D|nr:glyoxalase [Microlunatus sp. Gsoil 973]QGN32496.1 glyoxalase [Microlunatus sp. Gsoil 973]
MDTTTTTTPAITSISLEVDDVNEAAAFYAALDLEAQLKDQLRLRPAAAPSSGFRGFTLSLIADQPSAVDQVTRSAITAGATMIKPVTKSFWGYGGVFRSPDGTLWKVATSTKKDAPGKPGRIDELVILLGVCDMAATRDLYLSRGLAVAKSFGRKYVEFASRPGTVKLALYGRRALAKDAGVPPEGEGSHRLIINSTADPFTDPDGFAWGRPAEPR